MCYAACAQNLTGTLKKIKENGYISIGYRESSIPFSYLDETQRPVGYSIDICSKIIEAIKQETQIDNLEVKLIPVTSATRIPLIANGTIDLECGSTTNNAERQKLASYTYTHFLTASRFVAKTSSNMRRISDLRGKTIVSTAGTTNIKQVIEFNSENKFGMIIMPAKDHAEGFLLVETGRAVAFVMDDVLLASLVAGSKDPKLYLISEDAFSSAEPYGIMMPKDDPYLKMIADRAVASFFESTEVLDVYNKWFMRPIPPKGINLNIPLSDTMKNLYAFPNDSPDPRTYQ